MKNNIAPSLAIIAISLFTGCTSERDVNTTTLNEIENSQEDGLVAISAPWITKAAEISRSNDTIYINDTATSYEFNVVNSEMKECTYKQQIHYDSEGKMTFSTGLVHSAIQGKFVGYSESPIKTDAYSNYADLKCWWLIPDDSYNSNAYELIWHSHSSDAAIQKTGLYFTTTNGAAPSFDNNLYWVSGFTLKSINLKDLRMYDVALTVIFESKEPHNVSFYNKVNGFYQKTPDFFLIGAGHKYSLNTLKWTLIDFNASECPGVFLSDEKILLNQYQVIASKDISSTNATTISVFDMKNKQFVSASNLMVSFGDFYQQMHEFDVKQNEFDLEVKAKVNDKKPYECNIAIAVLNESNEKIGYVTFKAIINCN